MPEQALYLKWRPANFEDVIGQEHVTRTLQNSLKSERVRHAYLFSGPRGTGKTTTARLLAKAVNCTDDDPARRPCNICAACIAVNEGRFLDLIEIDAATHTGVDDVRDLREKIAFSPGAGRYKVYIIDEVHRFSGSAFDALLKTLEEPPDHAIFVLATTEIDKVPATIKSRCLQFEFRRVSLLEVADRLQLIAETEGLNAERPALELIARQGTGSVRDSISLLDQIVADPQEVISLELAQRVLGTANSVAVAELVDALIVEDSGEGLHIINTAVDSGSDPRQFGQQIVEYLRALLLAQTASSDLIEASADERQHYTQQAARIERGALLRAIRAFNDAVNNYRGGWQPQLALEMALLESLQAPQAQLMPAAPPPSQPQQTAQPPQSAPQHAPPLPEAEPGAAPLIPAARIQEQWTQLQRAAKKYNALVPALIEHAHVYRVDGNVVSLGVQTGVFRDKLDSPEKKQALERALADLHNVEMRVKIVLVASNQPPQPQADNAPADPLLRYGVEELGAEVHYDDELDDG